MKDEAPSQKKCICAPHPILPATSDISRLQVENPCPLGCLLGTSKGEKNKRHQMWKYLPVRKMFHPHPTPFSPTLAPGEKS